TEEVTTTEEVADSEEEDGMYKVKKEEYIVEHDGLQVYGRIFMPDAEGTFPAIILSHGYNGSADDWGLECNYYAQHGYVAYAYDFCGGSVNSRSSLKATEMTILSEKADLIAVFENISSLENVDKDRVYLMGGSQGGLVSALAAEELGSRVKAMILYFPAFCVPDNWTDMYASVDDITEVIEFWGMKLGKNFAVTVRDIDISTAIGGYEGSVIIMHGDQDAIVPLSYSQNIIKQYKKARLMLMPGEGHGFSPAGAQTAMENTLDFMDGKFER
ncbi:MAG: alpha/beta fold hydrolase, partial [Lachnospiraceae bacterium]|nr:alpha/beta fold hydrolase [Lachnospiraceae bacterium]